MLPEKSYGRFFGESLLEEIFHLDEELAQAIANKKNPKVEEELERSFDLAIQEGDSIARTILAEAKKKTPKKFHVYSAFGGTKLSSHSTAAAAHKAATEHSMKQPVHVWTGDGGDFGMGKPIAHYHNGKKTTMEDFEYEIHTFLEKALAEDEGPSCPDCGKSNLSFHPYDFGRDSQTGYNDAGERYRCHDCGSKGDADDAAPRKQPHK